MNATLQNHITKHLQAEQSRGQNWASRFAEGLFAFVQDHPEHEATLEKNLLQQPSNLPHEAQHATLEVFRGTNSNASQTRNRVRERRNTLHQSALELAQTNNTEALRGLSGQTLQLALRAATPNQAEQIIAAWNTLPSYEQQR